MNWKTAMYLLSVLCVDKKLVSYNFLVVIEKSLHRHLKTSPVIHRIIVQTLIFSKNVKFFAVIDIWNFQFILVLFRFMFKFSAYNAWNSFNFYDEDLQLCYKITNNIIVNYTFTLKSSFNFKIIQMCFVVHNFNHIT